MKRTKETKTKKKSKNTKKKRKLNSDEEDGAEKSYKKPQFMEQEFLKVIALAFNTSTNTTTTNTLKNEGREQEIVSITTTTITTTTTTTTTAATTTATTATTTATMNATTTTGNSGSVLNMVIIGGVPGAGKSTMAKLILEKCTESPTKFKYLLLVGCVYPRSNLIVFGQYEENSKLGLDCYSHQAQPLLLEALAALAKKRQQQQHPQKEHQEKDQEKQKTTEHEEDTQQFPDLRKCSVFLEGDRVATLQCLTKVTQIPHISLKIYLLLLEEQVWKERLEKRQQERGKEYNKTWLQTTKSKIVNIQKKLVLPKTTLLLELANNNIVEQGKNVNVIWSALKH